MRPRLDDATVVGAVLAVLVEEYPATFTACEVERLIGGPARTPVEIDQVRRCVDELARWGLLTIEGDRIVPTVAARRCYQLLRE